MAENLPSCRREFVETSGRLCQRLGLPRSTGQIYGLLYLSPLPLSLDAIAMLLSLSKASASTGTRQLVAWQALRQVWVPGDRRDHFEAIGDLRELLRTGYEKFFRPKLERSVKPCDDPQPTLMVSTLDTSSNVMPVPTSPPVPPTMAPVSLPGSRPAPAVPWRLKSTIAASTGTTAAAKNARRMSFFIR